MTEDEPTRYRKSKEREESKGRWQHGVDRLNGPALARYDLAIEALTQPTPCIKAGLPSKWTDWDEVPENREPQDTIMPTAEEAEEMCKGCWLLKDNVCFDFAMALGDAHGVWGGKRFMNGAVVSDDHDSIDRPNRERG